MERGLESRPCSWKTQCFLSAAFRASSRVLGGETVVASTRWGAGLAGRWPTGLGAGDEGFPCGWHRETRSGSRPAPLGLSVRLPGRRHGRSAPELRRLLLAEPSDLRGTRDCSGRCHRRPARTVSAGPSGGRGSLRGMGGQRGGLWRAMWHLQGAPRQGKVAGEESRAAFPFGGLWRDRKAWGWGARGGSRRPHGEVAGAPSGRGCTSGSGGGGVGGGVRVGSERRPCALGVLGVAPKVACASQKGWDYFSGLEIKWSVLNFHCCYAYTLKCDFFKQNSCDLIVFWGCF